MYSSALQQSTPVILIHTRTTRLASYSSNLYLPRYKTNKMQRSFKFQRVKIWNSIPNDLRKLSFNQFKMKCKKIFFFFFFFFFFLQKKKKSNRPLAQLLSARYRCGRSGVRFPGRSNRHSVANDSPPLRRFFGAVLPRR